jgi:tetratricopeptide (TPR) repeat protein
MGRFEEARKELRRALELDPLSLIINVNSAYPYHYTHQYDAAIAIYRKTIDLDPNFGWAHEDLMLAYEQQGKTREAIEEGVIALRLSGEAELAAAVQRAYTTGGYRAALERWLEGVREQSQSHYVSPMKFAQLYTRLGDKDQAFAWLQKAYEERSAPMVYLNVDPRYDGLRADPRFAGLLKKLKLQ